MVRLLHPLILQENTRCSCPLDQIVLVVYVLSLFALMMVNAFHVMKDFNHLSRMLSLHGRLKRIQNLQPRLRTSWLFRSSPLRCSHPIDAQRPESKDHGVQQQQ